MSAADVDALEAAIAAHPTLAAPYRELVAALRARVDPTWLALCEALVRDLLGAPPLAGVDARFAAIGDWRDAADFSDAERAVLAFAETFVLDPRRVTDAHVAALRRTLDPPAIVALAEALAWLDGFTRARLALGVA